MNDHEDSRRLIDQLRASGQADLDQVSSKKIQQTLLAEFDRTAAAAAGRTEKATGFVSLFRIRPVFALALIAVLVTASLGTMAAANAANPGDPLFGWDRAAERLRLALTLGERQKAAYTARVAEERLHEQFELEDKQSDHAVEAATAAGTALEQAIQTVGEVQGKLESKPGKGAASLKKVESRLRELQERRAARKNAKKPAPKKNDEVDPKKNESGAAESDDDNGAKNVNSGAVSDEHSSTSIQVQVNEDEGQTTIETKIAGQEQHWELSSTVKADILASISAKTGLTNAEIIAIWDFEQE